MIGFYNYTVILTYMSLVSSVLGMFFACGLCGGQPHPEYAMICLMVSGLCDMFDGKVARTKKDRSEAEKKFGIQIDSLCDAVCFGVLPSIIGYSVGLDSWCDMPVLILFPLCAVIRLAYFNVAEEERQQKTSDVRKVYEGLPVTSVALILPLVYSFHKDIGAEWFPAVYGTALFIIAIAFITRFKLKKPGIKTMFSFIGIGVLELIWLLYKTKTR
ncbi:MAG TPA: CDP-alcohol phosphatidyltransferase family protein [Ruminococcus sp.]|nr:CDP-alcohol phosphatidyltransferase family protein [Ruminococcus sp.]HPY85378.1 CDP-alcohol phosphatidyltransferase family protein [Ruminococcus flavefaciens]HRU97119.1 CDP-alcohol phosphatidyltransferase family protein [Ruminococcus sp.]